MAESYPHQEPGGAPAGPDPDLERLVARLKQDEVQLAADQRQLRQQRMAFDRLKAELDGRQQELDAAVQSLQGERQLLQEQKQSAEQALDLQRGDQYARQEALARQAADLQETEQRLQLQARQIETQQRNLEDRQRHLQGQEDRLATQQRDLDAQQGLADAGRQDLRAQQELLDARKQALEERQASLERREVDLQSRIAGLAEQEAQRQQQTKELTGEVQRLERQHAELREQFERRQQELRAQQQRREEEIERQVADLAHARRQLAEQQSALREQETALRRQQEVLPDQQPAAADRQADLQRQAEQVQADQRRLREQAMALESQRNSLAQEQAALERRQADLADAHKMLQRRQAEFTDLQARGDSLAKDRRDLRAQQADLHQQQEQVKQLEGRLAEKQRHLEELEARLASWQRSLEAEKTADKARPQSSNDIKLAAANEQVVSLTRRLQGLQAELEQVRSREQSVAAQRDELADQYSALQSRLDVLAASQMNKPAVAAFAQAPADDLADLAAQAVQARRRSALTRRLPRARGNRPLVVGAGLAVLAGLIVGIGLFELQAARYWLRAQIVFSPSSPLAGGVELAKAQRELGGRLLEARLPGTFLPVDRPAVAADTKDALLTVQLLTVSPEPSQVALRKILAEYRIELEGSIQDAARTQQDREAADQVVSAETQIKHLTLARQALQTEADKAQAQSKAYEAAQVAAQNTRKELEEANRKNSDASARLRVLQRTPPGARVELSPERLAAAAAGDVQLAEVRGQVTARATELRALLGGLLASAAQKCDQMDAQLDGFGKFITSQQDQMSDEAMRIETARIGEQAASLKGIVQRARKKIEDLSGTLAKSQDVSRASSLVTVQAQSEKALESLTTEAADQIKQVDDLLEKIPAGGVDVTRRTVLQQRLRSHFAQVQKTQREMSDTLDGLRPAVNFKLDAALTAVSGLARRLEDRQKALTEQVQQQDAQSRRGDYDRQLQQARAEQDELGIVRDRLIARLTEAAQGMQDADAGRSKWIQLRSQIEDLDRRIADARSGLEAGKQKQASLLPAATQAAPIRLEEPRILQPAVNHAARIAAAIAGGLIASVLMFGGYILATRRMSVGRAIVPVSPEPVMSRN